MPKQYILTYRDLIDQVVDSQGALTDGVDDRTVRRAIQEAYRQVTTDHKWAYLYKHGQITTVAPYSTGTIAYTHSTKVVTLTSGTFPTGAASYKIKTGTKIGIIKTQDSGTQVTLDDDVNFGADVAAGASYTVFQSTYPLPIDFVSMSEILQESSWYGARYLHPSKFVMLERFGQSSGMPQVWTIFGDTDSYGRMALGLYPYPDAVQTLQFIYYRRPRQLRYDGYSAACTDGTVSHTSGASTVTGVSTAFETDMKGSIIRTSSTSTDPTGLDGTNPFLEEKKITGFTSATSITVTDDSNFSNTISGKAYNISDPVDVDEVMIPALRICTEMWLAWFRRDYQTFGVARGLYEKELLRAASADNRSFSRKAVGKAGASVSNRLAYWPEGTDDA